MMNMLKSALIFSGPNLHFIAFVEQEAFEKLGNSLIRWKKTKHFTFQILPTEFPSNTSEDWRGMFRPCSTQRLFLPVSALMLTIEEIMGEPELNFQFILKDVDSLLYVDTDVIFMSPVEEIWEYFSKMSDQQIAGIASDDTILYTKPSKKIPYYGSTGCKY